MTFDPTSVEVTCVTLPKDHCVQVPWKYIKVCGYSDLFAKKNLKQRSLTPRWPLTPHLLRSHVWLYPRIILSKFHENTSKYVDTVNLFAKTWTKGHWPLDDLWPHICWGHMCDCAQGSLCPSPMGIRQCMWIQLSILQKLPHTYIHIHTTYILRTYYVHTTYYVQNQWSHRVSFWTMFRRDKKHDFCQKMPFWSLKIFITTYFHLLRNIVLKLFDDKCKTKVEMTTKIWNCFQLI